MNKKMMVASAVLVLMSSASTAAQASNIFDLSPTNNETFRGANNGPGQNVVAESNVPIDGFSMNIQSPSGGDVEFLIYNVSTSAIVYSSVRTDAAQSALSWQSTAPFSLTLAAGDTYSFGVISDQSLDVGYIYPQFAYTSGGISALTAGNANYGNYGAPAYDCCAGAEIGLRIEGGAAGAPEPAAWAMMLVGIAGLGGVLRAGRRTAFAA